MRNIVAADVFKATAPQRRAILLICFFILHGKRIVVFLLLVVQQVRDPRRLPLINVEVILNRSSALLLLPGQLPLKLGLLRRKSPLVLKLKLLLLSLLFYQQLFLLFVELNLEPTLGLRCTHRLLVREVRRVLRLVMVKG